MNFFIRFCINVNIAKNIGIENEEDDIAQHQDVEYIANNHSQDTFQFDVVDEVQVYKELKEINPKRQLVLIYSTKACKAGFTSTRSFYYQGDQLWHYHIQFLKMANVSPVLSKMTTCQKVPTGLSVYSLLYPKYLRAYWQINSSPS